MSDIFATLDFASDFFGQPDRNKQKISRREYISQDVDYYRQGLDSTGIKVSDPERWSDIDDDDEDANYPIEPLVLMGVLPTPSRLGRKN